MPKVVQKFSDFKTYERHYAQDKCTSCHSFPTTSASATSSLGYSSTADWQCRLLLDTHICIEKLLCNLSLLMLAFLMTADTTVHVRSSSYIYICVTHAHCINTNRLLHQHLLEEGCAVYAVLSVVSVCIRHIRNIFPLGLHFPEALEIGHISIVVSPCYRRDLWLHLHARLFLLHRV